MAQFGVDASLTTEDVRSQLAGPTKGYAERAPYREALRNLQPGQVLRITPSNEMRADGKPVESMRAIQFRIIGASKDTGVNVKYGKAKDDSGDVLVWLDSNPAESRPRRRRTTDSAESANGTADADIGARQPATV